MGDSEGLELLRQAVDAGNAAVSEIAVVKEQVSGVRRVADANHRLLHGNGEEGLKGRVSHVDRTARENEKRIAAIEDAHARRVASMAGATAKVAGSRWVFWKDVVVAVLALTGTVLAVVLN